jgi:hypothetical protein
MSISPMHQGNAVALADLIQACADRVLLGTALQEPGDHVQDVARLICRSIGNWFGSGFRRLGKPAFGTWRVRAVHV